MPERLLSKCLNFQRIMDSFAIRETQICKAKGIQVFCSGWSDGCQFPILFRSSEHLPREKIDFNKIE